MHLNFLSPCFVFGHQEPIRVMRGKTYAFECPRCLQITGVPLAKQKFKVRKVKAKGRVLKLTRKVG
jgi:hypothetical protein